MHDDNSPDSRLSPAAVETTQTLDDPPPDASAAAPARSTLFQRAMVVVAIALLSVAHVIYAGYQLGVGNQTIQIPFIQKYIDPTLYPNDAMVSETVKDYPSYFFKGLAWLVKETADPQAGRTAAIASMYLWLHLLTAFGMMLACYALAKAVFKSRLAGFLMILLLFAGHHRALAGDELYSVGFTHTWAVFPLAVAAMALLYRGWALGAFLLAGLLFNLHALTAAYLLAMFGLWALLDQPRKALWRVPVFVAVFLIAAAPTLAQMIKNKQVFDPEWVRLTRIRSADHSFASSWWQAGSSDIPRFMMLIGFGVLAMSFRRRDTSVVSPSPGTPGEGQGEAFSRLAYRALNRIEDSWSEHDAPTRTTILFGLAVLVLFAAGFFFSELRPWPSMMRAQLFRSSRLLLILALAYTAWGVASAWRTPGRGSLVPKWKSALEVLSGSAALLCVAVPQLLAFLPWAFALAVLVALVNGRLSWVQASYAALTLFVVALAAKTIEFHVPGLPGEPVSFAVLKQGWPDLRPITFAFWAAVAGGLALWAVSRVPLPEGFRVGLAAQGALACVLLVSIFYPHKAGIPQDPWIATQRWARDKTSPGAVFLTPASRSGFRMHSERSVVGEWRDGTQMYFTADFGRQWWENMQKVLPGIDYGDGKHRISGGKPIEQLSDDDLVALARSTGATHIVLPKGGAERNLRPVYSNDAFAVYVPQSLVPDGVVSKQKWLEQLEFIENVAAPNIEKHRKSDARIEVVDASGKPLTGVTYSLKQTKHAFGFGASLPFFAPVTGESHEYNNFHAAPVTQKELDAFLAAGFNYSVIPYSGKWNFIEPVEGRREYAELDKYVNWCHENGIEIEFHYLSGFSPSWLRGEGSAQAQSAFMRHCRLMIERYGDRIRKWQITNGGRMASNAAEVYADLRRTHPDLKLGLSSCTQFWNGVTQNGRNYGSGQRVGHLSGLNEVQYLQQSGARPDFFSLHGHSPHGVWPDVQEMYAVLDTFAREGVRLNVSEFMVPLHDGLPISGPVRRGPWTAELQAEYFEMFYTVLFSHPAVDSINYWNLGPDSAHEGAGMLDNRFQPKPTYNKVKELITKRWRTNLDGQLDGSGALAFRGFHGEYEVEVKADGKTLRGRFKVQPGQGNQHRVVVTESLPAGNAEKAVATHR